MAGALFLVPEIGAGLWYLLFGATAATVVVAAVYNADEIEEAVSGAIERAKRGVCASCCPPCVPPVGTIGGRLDRVPPSAPHHPCPGDHINVYIRAQNPKNCQCFWSPQKGAGSVLCLPQGGSAPPNWTIF
ncbi:hypothetical protein FS827_27745 [Agrobacterium vitis]|nr:hypothetical protein [Allorhizobium ampelinum]MCF1470593.1 hypothetical protein [Allorhizobium ampelinum]MCF1493993.1 hypothetical protein [Allorhizobium ampelinum]MCF1497807.1 hypothetical protein [Allorhizobium sp. Av2]